MSGVKCPFCGEAVSEDAQICRHCQRNIQYCVMIGSPLEDRQKLDFFKRWQNLPKDQLKHKFFGPYSEAKNDLSKSPLVLIWDLTQKQSTEIVQNFPNLPIEARLQSGLSSTYFGTPSSEVVESSSFNWGAAISFAIFLLAIGGAFYWAGSHFQKKEQKIQGPEVEFEFKTDEHSSRAKPAPAEPEQQAVVPPPYRDSSTSSPLSPDRDQMNALLNATVYIHDSNKLGSGFLITSDGYLVTNAHVSSDMAEPIVILRDGRHFTAEKVREDKKLDAALLKIPVTGAEYLKLGDANKLYPGESVIAIGNPGGLSFTVTRGIVSYVGRTINGVPFIQTDAAINKGNSGGPMINENLEVVGINSLTSLHEQGISFALPINFICAPNGIGQGINSSPNSCAEFNSQRDPAMTASLDRRAPQSPHNDSDSGLPASHYQDEADDLKAQLAREEKDQDEESAQIKQEMTGLLQELNQDPNSFSLQDRIKPQLEEDQHKLDAIARRKVDSHVRYIDQLISLLERQKADSSFATLADRIDDQIEELRKARQKWQSSMN